MGIPASPAEFGFDGRFTPTPRVKIVSHSLPSGTFIVDLPINNGDFP